MFLVCKQAQLQPNLAYLRPQPPLQPSLPHAWRRIPHDQLCSNCQEVSVLLAILVAWCCSFLFSTGVLWLLH